MVGNPNYMAPVKVCEMSAVSNVITEAELSAIEARCAAATPGPWEGDDGNVYTEWSREEYAEERGYEPQGTGFDEIRICEINAYNADISDEEVEANEQFIAHARTDIPALLSHIRELEAELAHRYMALEWVADVCKRFCDEAICNDDCLLAAAGACKTGPDASHIVYTALNATTEAS